MWLSGEIRTKMPPTELPSLRRENLRMKTKTIKISTYLLHPEKTRRTILWEQKKCLRMELLQDPHCHEMKVGSLWHLCCASLTHPSLTRFYYHLIDSFILRYLLLLNIIIYESKRFLFAAGIQTGIERTQTTLGWSQEITLVSKMSNIFRPKYFLFSSSGQLIPHQDTIHQLSTLSITQSSVQSCPTNLML